MHHFAAEQKVTQHCKSSILQQNTVFKREEALLTVTQTPAGASLRGHYSERSCSKQVKEKKEKNEHTIVKKSLQVVFGGRTERYTYIRHFHEQRGYKKWNPKKFQAWVFLSDAWNTEKDCN